MPLLNERSRVLGQAVAASWTVGLTVGQQQGVSIRVLKCEEQTDLR